MKENIKTEENSSIVNKETTVKRRGTRTHVPRTNETKTKNQIQKRKEEPRTNNQPQKETIESKFETQKRTRNNERIPRRCTSIRY